MRVRLHDGRGAVDVIGAWVDKAGKVLAGLTHATGRRALARGVGAAIEHDRILTSRPWRTVIDIGANRGQFALAARMRQPGVTVHSFEPLAQPGDVFENVFAGQDGVSLHRCAIGEAAGLEEMHVSTRDDSSSLLPIGEGQVTAFPGTQEAERQTVRVARLEAELTREDLIGPVLLKMDVQGFEYQALKGCEALLDAFDAIYVECSLIELYTGQRLFGEVHALLAGHGFELSDLGPVQRIEGRAVQADFLFNRKPVAADASLVLPSDSGAPYP